jgi:hypothetical protein
VSFVRIAPPVVLASLLALAPAAHADQTIATVPRATPVSAYRGHVVWSTYHPGRGYVLTAYDKGTVSELPVTPRGVPFDADVGPGPNGDAVVVYSRCRRDPRRRQGFPGSALTVLPEWQSGRGCDLYRFTFARGRETRIARASSRRASEFLPSVWKGRIAFARVYPHRRGRAGRRAYLYTRPLSGAGRTRRLPAGPRSTARFCSGKPRRCRTVLELGPTALDLGEGRLAFGWDSAMEGDATSAAYLDTTGSHPTRHRLARVASGDIQASELIGPALRGHFVWWAESMFGDQTEHQVQRFSIKTRITASGPFAIRDPQSPYILSVLAHAVDDENEYYLLSGAGIGLQGEPCTSATPCISTPGCTQAAPCELRTAPVPGII